MKDLYIDFEGIKTYWHFYEAIIKGLEFLDWCGKNADAIWDLLTGHIEYHAIIYVKGIKSLPNELSEEIDIILNIFNRAEKWYFKLNKKMQFVITD